jgi:phosphohistidine phosphatase SixA
MINNVLTRSLVTGSLILTGFIAPNVMATDTNIIYLTRHAEKLDTGSDPSLSEAGQLRAMNIATMLQKAQINGIYSTSYNRTLETATPLSELISVGVQTYNPSALSDFSVSLKTLIGNTLVVGHSNTTPELVTLLGGDAGTTIDESEYDRLYQLIFNQDGSVTTVRFTSLPSETTKNCEVSNLALSQLSANEGDWTYYELEVPECAVSLSVTMSDGTGDADLYVKYGAKPTSTTYDCRPFETGNNENCAFTEAQAGTYHIALKAYEAFSGLSLSTNIQ